jgi:5-methylcytosine-specific restriction protein B
VLLLDDVQRADLARVMGEALHALEYRAQPARLASGTELVVPRDVYVIGTLNASHRAITTADQSLRRRFAFIALPPRYDVLARYLAARGFDAAGLVDTLRAMNQALGVDAAVGTAMFFRDDLADVLDDVWEHEVEAHLAQHLAHDPGALASYRWARVCDAVRPTARRALGA